ncbi:helix-turn-helix transcriptional regulator [Niameybacter massiliensis]|uniref:Helix-turn-helix transcriptional regulator n=1 Tax=Holtiella tumoricola TaxID=3018743 RepID=A0AA42DQ75_9FIRM|nr:helix-turn-helix transcriptional regulator [Holtiella tumoricola]MDA3732868.1 helix-turn-helix transcriptional regulator [Holtiella tumoricola]
MKVNEFRRMLMKARKEKGLSQEDVALILNTAQSCVSDWENGKVEPSFSTVIQLTRIYEEPMVYSLFVSDEHGADDLVPVIVKDIHQTTDLRITALDIQNEYNDVTEQIPKIMRILRDGVISAHEKGDYEKFIKESKEFVSILIPLILKEEIQKKKALQDCRLERAYV